MSHKDHDRVRLEGGIAVTSTERIRLGQSLTREQCRDLEIYWAQELGQTMNSDDPKVVFGHDQFCRNQIIAIMAMHISLLEAELGRASKVFSFAAEMVREIGDIAKDLDEIVDVLRLPKPASRGALVARVGSCTDGLSLCVRVFGRQLEGVARAGRPGKQDTQETPQ